MYNMYIVRVRETHSIDRPQKQKKTKQIVFLALIRLFVLSALWH